MGVERGSVAVGELPRVAHQSALRPLPFDCGGHLPYVFLSCFITASSAHELAELILMCR